MGMGTVRQTAASGFESRLFRANENKASFNKVLGKVLDPAPDWVIDQHDTGQHFLKFVSEDGTHSSEGVGEGIVSLFFLVDALYDSRPGDVIFVDEPELSLHPAVQRRVSDLFTEYAAERQIVVATHSPYSSTSAPCRLGPPWSVPTRVTATLSSPSSSLTPPSS